jgi:hypothetical protein
MNRESTAVGEDDSIFARLQFLAGWQTNFAIDEGVSPSTGRRRKVGYFDIAKAYLVAFENIGSVFYHRPYPLWGAPSRLSRRISDATAERDQPGSYSRSPIKDYTLFASSSSRSTLHGSVVSPATFAGVVFIVM